MKRLFGKQTLIKGTCSFTRVSLPSSLATLARKVPALLRPSGFRMACCSGKGKKGERSERCRDFGNTWKVVCLISCLISSHFLHGLEGSYSLHVYFWDKRLNASKLRMYRNHTTLW